MRRLIGTGLRIALAFVSVPLYAHFIGISQWGMLMLFQAAAAPLALLDLGTGPALVKRVSEALGRGDEEAAARTVRASMLFNVGVLAVGAGLLLLLSGWFARSAFAIPARDVATAVQGFRLVALAWSASAALAFFTNVLVAHQRYDEVLRTSTFALVASTAAGLSAAAVTRDVAWVLLAQTVGAIAAAVLAFDRAARLLPGLRGRLRWDASELRRLLGFGGWYTVANFGVLLATWSDRYVLGAFFVPRIVGFYALAQQMQQLISTLFTEGGDVLFPAVSLRHGMGDLTSARRLALLAGWLLTTAFGPVAIAVAVLGGDFLRLWISADAAREAAPVLRLLCATSIVGLAAVAPVIYAMGMGKSYWQAPFSLVSGVCSVAFSIALVPSLGIRGIGFGLLAGAAIRWIVLVPLWRTLFRPDVSGRDFLLQVCTPPLVSGGLLALLAPLHDAVPHAPGWLAFVVESALFLVAVAGIQFAVGEVLPGGRERRHDVVRSFRPIMVRAGALLRGGEPR